MNHKEYQGTTSCKVDNEPISSEKLKQILSLMKEPEEPRWVMRRTPLIPLQPLIPFVCIGDSE